MRGVDILRHKGGKVVIPKNIYNNQFVFNYT